MEVATPKFIAKWSQEENREEHFRKRVKASVPDHLQYAEPLLGARLQVNEEQYD
jgi:hypothetical protein